jgi:hypothetical protein
VNKSESIGKISAALVKAQSEMGSATKGASNPFFKSKFADLNSIREASIPVLTTHGIGVFQPTTTVDGKAFIETILLHESGEFISSLTEIVVSKQNDPQAAGSGQSYARRYGLQAFLCIACEDDDGESAMGRNVKASPAKTVTVEVAKTEADVAPAKKTGFGVKAVTAVATVTKETTDDSWS